MTSLPVWFVDYVSHLHLLPQTHMLTVDWFIITCSLVLTVSPCFESLSVGQFVSHPVSLRFDSCSAVTFSDFCQLNFSPAIVFEF